MYGSGSFDYIEQFINSAQLRMAYKFFKKGTMNHCYRCLEGDQSKLSKDHLPPDKIFPEHERTGLQLISAKICGDCKGRFHRGGEDDNYFLCHMLLLANISSPSTEIQMKLEKCLRTLTKGQKILETEELSVTLPSGERQSYYVLKGGKERVLRVLDNIARGFYYRMRKEIIPEYVVLETEFTANENLKINLLPIQTACVVKKGVFEFKPILYENDDEGAKFLCWEFKFYNPKPFPIYYRYNVRNKEYVHK